MEIPWIQLFFFLHIGAAIVAFGPTFIFPLIGGMGGKEPMHVNFATRVSAAIERRVVLPVALTMPLSGIGLIWLLPINLLASTGYWLLAGIALYSFAIAFVIFRQDPAIHKVIDMTSRPPGPPAGGPPDGGPPPGGPPPGGAPPPVVAAGEKGQQGGKILGITLIVIFFLMIFRPLS
jgi:hypothetical protein